MVRRTLRAPRRRANIRRRRQPPTNTKVIVSSRPRRPRQTRARPRAGPNNLTPMSVPGVDFLKAAFAAPDFRQTGSQGIPDAFTGKTILKRQRFVLPMSSSDTLDTYIMLAPTPGVPFWIGGIDGGTIPSNTNSVAFIPVANATEFDILFPELDEDSNFSSFRFCGAAIEVVCTANAMKWEGALQVWRGRPKQSTYTDASAANSTSITIAGTNCVTPTADCYLGASNLGSYSVGVQAEPEWEFTSISIGAQNAIKSSVIIDPNMTFHLDDLFVGWGNFDCVFIKIPKTSTALTYTIRSWADIEYQVTTSSPLYEYAHFSPPHDPMALEAYRRTCENIPIAVPVYENAGFWSTVWQFINPITNPLRPLANLLPGVYGLAANQVNNALNLLKPH